MERISVGTILKLIAYGGVSLFILHIILAFLMNCLPANPC